MEISELKNYDPSFLLKLLEDMLLIRRFEETAAKLYGLRKIGGFCHLYNGEEAVGVGAISAINTKKDYVFSAYRDHGHALTCGLDPKFAMAELLGKATGCSKGKGGSMHFFDIENNFYGGNGIVGAHIPLATGAAYKIRYNNEDGAVLCFFGDGAIHQGSFHESLNMAKIWNLPIIYICENNQYGMGTYYERVSSVSDLSSIGQAYGISGKQIDGMDVVKVHQEVSEAVKFAKNKKSPVLLEAKTYRYKGHSMTDPAKYRTAEELEEYKKQDPIYILKDALIQADLLFETDYEKLDDKIKNIIKEAVNFAESSEEPKAEELYTDILA